MAQKVWRLCLLVFGHDRYSYAETALISFRKLTFSTLTSFFDATHSLAILDSCSCINSPMPGVQVSLSKFLVFSPLHHCLQFLAIGHRFVLMHLHVVQFQYSFELRGLTCSQFAQTIQDIIGWNFDTDSRTSSHLVSNS